MALDDNKYKSGILFDYYWCKRFECWRRRDQEACDAYVGGKNNCFLTSACVFHKGLADDCAELTALRKFRDSYMMKTAEGSKLVEEYYAIAPSIVEKIEKREDKDEIYDSIYADILACIKLIEEQKFEETVAAYAAMVRRIEKTVG
jgi:hypothetical protein